MPDIVLRKAVENADNTAKGREPVRLPSPNADKAAQTFLKCRQSGGAGFFRIRRGGIGSFSAVPRKLFQNASAAKRSARAPEADEQGAVHFAHRAGRQRPDALLQAPLIQRADLLEQDHRILLQAGGLPGDLDVRGQAGLGQAARDRRRCP